MNAIVIDDLPKSWTPDLSLIPVTFLSNLQTNVSLQIFVSLVQVMENVIKGS